MEPLSRFRDPHLLGTDNEWDGRVAMPTAVAYDSSSARQAETLSAAEHASSRLSEELDGSSVPRSSKSIRHVWDSEYHKACRANTSSSGHFSILVL